MNNIHVSDLPGIHVPKGKIKVAEAQNSDITLEIEWIYKYIAFIYIIYIYILKCIFD